MFQRIAEAYRDSTAVIVGAGGIGREIIRRIADHAARVIVVDSADAPLARLSEISCRAQLDTQRLDVRDSQAVAAFAGWLAANAGPPQFCFYTAGILLIEPFVDTSAEKWRLAVDVNLNGFFFFAQAMAELMIPERRGSILVVGSIAGTRARSGARVNPVYNATKAGLSALVNSTAMQLRPHGIRINCISPGPTATAMMDLQPAGVHDSIKEITLDRRMNEPSEVAELALFVAGHGRFTGEDVAMGGGAGLGG